MADIIKLNFISDVVCPWCIIGYKRLQQAIDEMDIQDKVELDWQPFELNPDMPAEGEEITTHLTRKYGTTVDDNIASLTKMTQLGTELGFRFDYVDGMKMVNTREVHILLDYAKDFGKQTELEMRFFEAFFSEHKDVSDRQVLTQEWHRIGLNIEDALIRLDNDSARDQVQSREAHWRNLGVSSVPTIVFNHTNTLTGAQPVEVYKQVFAELIEQ